MEFSGSIGDNFRESIKLILEKCLEDYGDDLGRKERNRKFQKIRMNITSYIFTESFVKPEITFGQKKSCMGKGYTSALLEYSVPQSNYSISFPGYLKRVSGYTSTLLEYSVPRSSYSISFLLYLERGSGYTCSCLLLTVPRSLYRTSCLLYLDRGSRYICACLLLTVLRSLYRTSCLLYLERGLQYI